ncbi:MAG: redox-regulated ATPase YchF [candidate division Zixibacteria bacterium]|nr:redox-regulated ATPase YchF [candidate division Zixibacteria bacterium]
MKLQFGIIGLGQSGKTTIFNALCSADASVGDYSSSKGANIGMVKVPDERVDKLAVMYSAPKRVYAEIEFIDIAGMAPSSQGKQDIVDKLKEGSYIHQIRMAQALLIVVRCFEDENVPHPRSSINPKRDICDIESELMLVDLVQIEKRIENITHLIKVKSNDKLKSELTLMEKMKAHLETEKPLRELDFNKDERQFLGSFRFLSEKPVLYLLNLGEDQISKGVELEKQYMPETEKNKAIASLCGKIEMEISALDESDRDEFLNEMGIGKPALAKVLKKSYDLLGIISFLTAAENESRAWPIPRGFTAWQAAGEIHTDIQRGFIKAETIYYKELLKAGDLNTAKKAGKLRLEGKDYIIKDGDVILYRFNV